MNAAPASQDTATDRLRLTLGYAAMLLAAGGLFWLIVVYGQTLPTPAVEATAPKATAAKAADVLPRVLIALVAVIGFGRALGWLLGRFGQPPVIGEVVAGILLGPSLIGKEASALILPDAAAPFLRVLAQLGVILYMFVVGLERLCPKSLHVGRLHDVKARPVVPRQDFLGKAGWSSTGAD